MRFLTATLESGDVADASRTAEAELIERVRSGDSQALGHMYDAHHSYVRAFATRLVGDPHAAEDLVHDVFVALPKAIRRYRGESSLRSFLMGVTVNHARHHQRAAARRRRTWEAFAEAEFVTNAFGSGQNNPVIARQLAELHRALDELPEAQRVAFVICEVEGQTSAEAAVILDVPEGTVRTRLFHARGALRKILGDGGEP